MRETVVVVDYGRGNLFSIERALASLGAQAKITSDPLEIMEARRLILPGVGAFGDGMAGLRERGLVEPLKRYAAAGRPLLGICLGMQLLLEESEEFGRHEGLGLVEGRVTRFAAPPADGPRYKVPHVGWSGVAPADRRDWDGTALAGLKPGVHMYFVHSYVVEPQRRADWLGVTRYAGSEFCSVLKSGNIHGCQFHPEKSGPEGLCLLKSWFTRN